LVLVIYGPLINLKEEARAWACLAVPEYPKGYICLSNMQNQNPLLNIPNSYMYKLNGGPHARHNLSLLTDTPLDFDVFLSSKQNEL
jgi:hypothetical protein